jgi:predicted GNAT family acetyltransferase
MENQSEVVVQNNPARNRFEVHLDNAVAELTYQRSGDTIVFVHTGVPKEISGRGIATLLAQTGLEFARVEKLKVVPECPFVRGYLRQHPEYHDLLDPTVDLGKD